MFEIKGIDVTEKEVVDEELTLYFSMNENQLFHYFEPELGLFVVESPMVIERALMSGYEPRSFVMIDSVADEICKKFESMLVTCGIADSKIPVYVADYETIAGMTGVNITRGVLALMKRKPSPTLAEIVGGCRRIAVFDDVENPTNVGAMFRSAAALGIEAIVLTGASSDPLYRRASRVSVGTVFQVPWTKLPKGKAYVDELQSLGFKTAAMALTDDSVSIDDKRLLQEDRLAIILGNEGFGLSEEVINASDYVVKIPMQNNVDSLNVAAASSIAFWEIMK
ncbi:MAG: RNA methyltransferase [Eubacterium sp.]|nr:RNA methyltransferase [Eubacterium sp.]